MQPRLILDKRKLQLTLERLCYQLIENHHDFSETVLIGVQPRGIHLSNRLVQLLEQITGRAMAYGFIDPTFFRDDYRMTGKKFSPRQTELPVSIEGKKVVLIDDVLFSGRTVRASLDALMSFGRPQKVELLVLIDRRFTRELPIQPDYVGMVVDSLPSEKVTVKWEQLDGDDQIWITPLASG
ncbi:MAG: bifunctional pyr operon transcriptional regulator/uracil phosphoribosyltransferase PyrR [Chitinophagales bacterium]|nr:bifunctional pyr operon transcriptional regulator/uracil phosphoribosyltransferase PyrR [Chitinophagales bacterium]MDW8394028.1 bifunctional pyr operon transcriptional regulator/uracil phosphoribosyltransferase PyrR [Chitinophagales bacterium]